MAFAARGIDRAPTSLIVGVMLVAIACGEKKRDAVTSAGSPPAAQQAEPRLPLEMGIDSAKVREL